MVNITSPAVLGFLKALGFAVIFSVISYLANVSNLQGVFNPTVAAVISALAMALESSLGAKSGTALFGAVKTK